MFNVFVMQFSIIFILENCTIFINCAIFEKCAKHPHCGKKDWKFPSQVTDAVDHNKPVTENSGIKFPTSLSDCSAIYNGIFSAIYFGIKMC